MTSSLKSSSFHNSTVLLAHLPPSADAALPPHPRLQTSYPPSTHFVFSSSVPSPPPHVPGCFSIPTVSSSPLTLLWPFNEMLEVSESGALNYYTLFQIPGFSALRFDRTHFRSGLLSSNTTHASGGVIIFVRQGLSIFKLSTSSLSSLDPYSDYVGVIISLNISSSLSFLKVNAPPIRFSPTDSRTDSFSLSILPSSRNIFILGDFNYHHHFWKSKGTSDP